MQEEDTYALLIKNLANDPSSKKAKEELITELGFIPLAITQASAYIVATGPRMTVAKYLQMLLYSRENKIRLLVKD